MYVVRGFIFILTLMRSPEGFKQWNAAMTGFAFQKDGCDGRGAREGTVVRTLSQGPAEEG